MILVAGRDGHRKADVRNQTVRMEGTKLAPDGAATEIELKDSRQKNVDVCGTWGP